MWSGETLLCLIDATNSTTHYYLQDANKNITELLDGNGNLTAHYEYSPFGKTSVLNGSYSISNPFRFSSEFADDETSLVYYNYRYYNPELGRWLSRDPIAEKGGQNLYGMLGNNPINRTDYLGYISDEEIMINALRQAIQRCNQISCECEKQKCIERASQKANEWLTAQGKSNNEGVLDILDALVDGLIKGNNAVADGMIPFADPLIDTYSDGGNVDDIYHWSQELGAIGRDSLLAAMIPNLSAWAKNPLLYELGQTTTTAERFAATQDMTPIERGAEFLNQAGGNYFNAFADNVSLGGFRSTWNTGGTPGANLLGLGVGHTMDAMSRK